MQSQQPPYLSRAKLVQTYHDTEELAVSSRFELLNTSDAAYNARSATPTCRHCCLQTALPSPRAVQVGQSEEAVSQTRLRRALTSATIAQTVLRKRHPEPEAPAATP
jgi:uncharacterized protein involved in type VI secretion and phage assembly